MSTNHDDIDTSNARQALESAADPENGIQRSQGNAEVIHEALTRAWGMLSFKIGAAERAVPVSAYRKKLASEPETTEEKYGTRSPFVAAATAGAGGVLAVVGLRNDQGTALASASASDTPTLTVERTGFEASEYGSVGGSGSLTIETG